MSLIYLERNCALHIFGMFAKEVIANPTQNSMQYKFTGLLTTPKAEKLRGGHAPLLANISFSLTYATVFSFSPVKNYHPYLVTISLFCRL